jgi:hypothetical protein
MKNLFNVIKEWFLNTKLGYFIIMMLFVPLISILTIICTNGGSFINGIIGGGIFAVFFAIASKKRFW